LIGSGWILNFVLDYIRRFFRNGIEDIYRELIAIKPGFHELWVHKDYFNSKPGGDKPRDIVFKELRGCAEPKTFNFDKFPAEINCQSYLTYASCSITERPFVFRKLVNTKYYNELRKIDSFNVLESLIKLFHIYSYHKKEINSPSKLMKVLKLNLSKDICRR
jgi:hypothetical protein